MDSSIRLRIAGSGPAENSLRALTRQLGIDDKVVFEGRLDRQGVVALYAKADAVLNPALVDNMPNSVLEALACGLPVISTDVGGVPYIVRHRESALLVPPADTHAMASAITELKNSAALYNRLRNNGLAEIEQYTWSNVGNEWLTLYASLRDMRTRQKEKVAT